MSIKYFAKFDDTGAPIGFFPSDIWPTPPEGAVEITQEQWAQFLNGQGSGTPLRLVNGQMLPVVLPPSMTVAMNYAAAITKGLLVTSASDAIEPTKVSLAMQQLSNLANVSIYIMRHNRFPGGQDSMPLITTDSASVEIPSIDAWQEIATAAADYVVLCDVALKAGMEPDGVWIAPSNTATIS